MVAWKPEASKINKYSKNSGMEVGAGLGIILEVPGRTCTSSGQVKPCIIVKFWVILRVMRLGTAGYNQW